MEAIDTFIVRVYRRDPREVRHFSGLVEIVASGGKKAFADGVELLDILSKGIASIQTPPRRKS